MKTVSERHLDHLTVRERQAATEFANKVYLQFDDQVESILLFGSRARGEAEADSDMDVVVVISNADPGTRKAIRHLAVEVWLKYGIYISTRVWSYAHYRKLEELQTTLYRNIRRDGINL
jgi:predicted nucleotidyltransferase